MALLMVTVPAVSSAAQDATGRIFGTVYDQQGAVIPEVQITVTNTATQVVRSAITDKGDLSSCWRCPSARTR
jgi:uncharacterized membrane-anchored protein